MKRGDFVFETVHKITSFQAQVQGMPNAPQRNNTKLRSIKKLLPTKSNSFHLIHYYSLGNHDSSIKNTMDIASGENCFFVSMLKTPAPPLINVLNLYTFILLKV